MNTKGERAFELRVARHAALGEPARLRIVDLLTLGDLSPTEIRDSLDIAPNLITHHLNALESVGMVTKSRSEADRRRSYVSLTEDALEGLTPGLSENVGRVVFVCTTNSARSQLAAALWQRESEIPVASGGTHPADHIAPGAIAMADRHGLALLDARPHQLDEILHDHDLVVTVCDNAHEALKGHGHLHWSVPDPVRSGTFEAFEAAFRKLARRVANLALQLNGL